MLRGYARNRPSNESLERALKIYRSIGSSKAGIQPSIIHHNAAVEVCGRHKNMDALWEVAGQLPDSGEGQPDHVTYTSILNSIRVIAEDDTRRLNEKGRFARIQEAIEKGKIPVVRQGKKIWADVVRRWRSGALLPDQRLVGAMGHLLLFGGRRQDLLDLFALLHQTMRIPLCVSADLPALPLKVTKMEERLGKALDTKPARPESDDASLASQTPEREIPESEEFRHLFDPVDLNEVRKAMEQRSGRPVQDELLLPLPSNVELCLLLEAFIVTRCPRARKYWSTLTSPEGEFVVNPDAVSYCQYLRCLRISRASGEALRVMRDEMAPRKMARRTAFIIAMSTCSRDRNNPHVLDNAGGLIELMNKTQRVPSCRILDSYMELVRICAVYSPGGSPPRID
jgi:hypothetical protein